MLERTALELRGIACLDLEELTPDKQQIRCSRSFGATVSSLEELTEAITTFTSRAAEKLRAQQGEAAAIAVEIRTSAFRPGTAPYAASRVVPLTAPSADTRALVAAARRGLQRLFTPGLVYSKAGVILLGLTRARNASRTCLPSQPHRCTQPGADGDAGSDQPPLRPRQPDAGECAPGPALAPTRAVPLTALYHPPGRTPGGALLS